MKPFIWVAIFTYVLSQSTFAKPLQHGLLDPLMRSLNDSSWGYKVVVASSAPAAYIERFEVRPGDCAASHGWNDCKEDRERSELSERHKTTHEGQTIWYHWQFYLPNQFINIYPAKVALGQFHQKNAKPAWIFELNDKGYALVRHLRIKPNYEKPLIAWSSLTNRWHDIAVRVSWFKSNKGQLDVWVDKKRKVHYQGPTMSADIIYFKYGLYRAFISRYQHSMPTQWVEYANVCSATYSLLTHGCPN
ncbi:heparin lyase I family protein [Celerinatantimonas sp. MCCC 1A17872]|uniref:heparin lyase I family protein n=1 Tax=Celerinatantimonas sp. MCCC 1A17872 TaxID=3177514 RepID=UPI0038C56383